MNYEIVTLPEKKAAGITARTNNHAPDMGSVIGGLWESFYAKGVYDSIPADRRGCVLGIYSDYESDENGDYDMTAACEDPHDPGRQICEVCSQGRCAAGPGSVLDGTVEYELESYVSG